MKVMRRISVMGVLAFLLTGLPAYGLTVHNVTITEMKVYVGSGDNINVWYYLNGNSRVGPNPSNSAYTCELWSANKSVHATALAAMLAGKQVSIDYVDRGEGTYWCLVNVITIIN